LNGETEAMCLVIVVIRILTDDDGFDSVEGGMARPSLFNTSHSESGDGESYHAYTSLAGGNIFCPLSCSRFKNRLSSRKLELVISSLSSLSQVSCRLSISNTSRFFCSSDRDATHFFFHSLCVAASGAESGIEDVGADEVDELSFFEYEDAGVFGFGAPKKEVIEALVFVFLVSERGRVEAFRFRDMMNVRMMKDSLID